MRTLLESCVSSELSRCCKAEDLKDRREILRNVAMGLKPALSRFFGMRPFISRLLTCFD